ncbi:flagellar protein FlgN [Gracilibacillus oryzae]|uniref:Flagellar protein FlgN n=1 Tax=Gracilibacillus oryzae TaxID=1672701 RepID=A0A7C8L267_9BACI|nr:flagellar protein FlgN [Gracilibacillus oryzae]KAB8139483.1 flagellar protein FlgN [Gracilibacillus oryzae]
MSVQTIIQFLEKMTELHASLLNLSKQKTEVLKEGKTDALRALLNKEQRHVQAINQIEQKRIDAVASWAKEKGVDPNITVSSIIEEHATGDEQKALEAVTLKLAELLMELRRQEDLNRQLTTQSLQFVQLSLDMVQPSLKNFNYGNQSGQTQQQRPKRSVFDSKA